MNRRTFLAVTGVTCGTMVAGCTSTQPASPTTPTSTEPTPGTDSDSATTRVPSTEPTSEQTAESPATGSLRAPTIRSTGSGTGTSDRFTALGGPAILTLTFDYAGMKNSNFIVRAVTDSGESLLPETLSLNELFAPEQSEETDEYTARLVTHFEPGDYFVDVTHAGGPYGNGDWEIVIEQPGVATTGQAVPLSIDGYDSDVIGPIALDGPVRVSLETLKPRLGFDGDPMAYNYQIKTADASGRPGELIVNSRGPAPESLSAVWFPEDATIGYLNVHSFGPWKATVEAA